MTTIPFDMIGFDLDGTLLDTHLDLAAAVNHALSVADRPSVPPSEVRALIGGGGRTMLRRALELTGGVDEDRFPGLHKALLDYYEANIAVHTTLFPGGLAMLDALQARGVALAVVSNKLEVLTRQVIAELGLTERFFTIIGGDTLGPGRAKPARDPIDAMIERGGGGKAAFVGDTTFDIGAARAAQVPCVAVSFGFNDLPATELGADAVIHHFDELIPALIKLD
ncbi:MAG: HAD hydrolase-like protein [Novosphingobium sp.]